MNETWGPNGSFEQFSKKSLDRILKDFLAKMGGFFNFFSVFCKNLPNGWKYGKVIYMFFEEFAKAFHHVLKFWKSVNGRLRKCANHFWPKNGLFSLADFHYNALADFAQILTEGAQGPQNVSSKNSGRLVIAFKSYSRFSEN